MNSSRKAYLKKMITECKRKLKNIDDDIWKNELAGEEVDKEMASQKDREEANLKRLEGIAASSGKWGGVDNNVCGSS